MKLGFVTFRVRETYVLGEFSLARGLNDPSDQDVPFSQAVRYDPTDLTDQNGRHAPGQSPLAPHDLPGHCDLLAHRQTYCRTHHDLCP